MSDVIHESKTREEGGFLEAKQRNSGGRTNRKTKNSSVTPTTPGAVLIPGINNENDASHRNALEDSEIDDIDDSTKHDNDEHGTGDVDDTRTLLLAARVVNDDDDDNNNPDFENVESKIQQEVEIRLKQHIQNLVVVDAVVDAIIDVRPSMDEATSSPEMKELDGKIFGLTRKVWCLLLFLILLVTGIITGVLVSSKADSPRKIPVPAPPANATDAPTSIPAEGGDAKCITIGDSISCPAQADITFDGSTKRIAADIVCPLAATAQSDFRQASQEGLCECNASLQDLDNMDSSPVPLDCNCFICPDEANLFGIAFECSSPITGPCNVFNCQGICNGELDFNSTVTDSPTSIPVG